MHSQTQSTIIGRTEEKNSASHSFVSFGGLTLINTIICLLFALEKERRELYAEPTVTSKTKY